MRCLREEPLSLWGHHVLAQTTELQPSKHLTTLSESNCYALWLCWSIWKGLGRDQKRYAKPTIAFTVSLLETIGLLVASLGKKVAVTFTNALTERDRS